MSKRSSATIVDYVYETESKTGAKKRAYIERESAERLILPLRVITLMIAISGLFAMIFEVRHFQQFALEVYLTRLSATLISFIILVVLFIKQEIKYPALLVHILLLTIIISSSIMILLMPSTLVVNSQIIGLMIFTTALFLAWDVRHQILVAIYYNIVFAAAVLLNDINIYYLPNMFETVLFVIFLSVLSVIGSALNYKLRTELAEKSYRVHLSERNFRSIFEHSAEGIFQSSPEGKFLTINTAMVRILGYENSEELKQIDIGTDLYYDPDERTRLLEIVRNEKEIKDYKIRLKKKNGDIIYALLNDRIIESDADNRFYYEGSIQDVTSQVKLEEERQRAETELKKEKEKSDKLAKEAVKSSEIKSQFLANMSHEIRTPINGILGFLTLIENGSYQDEAELKDFISSAKSSAEALLDLVNDILDFSKIEAGRMFLEEAPFNIQKVINDSLSVVYATATEKGLKLSVDIDKNTGITLIGDPSRLRQVFINLLSNAVKFTAEGEVIVKVRSEKVSGNQLRLTCSVTDTGVGIPPEKIAVLFQPFSQADGSHTRKFGGTGLGLAISKQIISLMEGSIWIESEVGRGTTFFFTVVIKFQKQVSFLDKIKSKSPQLPTEKTLPQVPDFEAVREQFKEDVSVESAEQRKSAEAATAEPEKIEAPPPAPRVPVLRGTDHFKPEVKSLRKKYKILLAEDNAVNKKVVMRILSDAGFDVTATSNGLEALTAISSDESYNLVLMDVQMPEMDGFTATQKIRLLKGDISKIPIIALTAHALAGDKERCLAAGMDDYLTKPIRNDELLSLLDKYLGVDYAQMASLEKSAVTVDFAEELFDKEHFKTISLDNQEFQKELLTTYIDDTKRRLTNLEKVARTGEVTGVVAESHTIKGASYSIGAKLMGDQAKEIEMASRNNQMDGMLDKITVMRKTFESLIEILKEYL
ncbi:MAG: response regulator [Ignavibacteriaceae bacterium]|nr:response regulator [Ignavibacteriaceae bacterium]